MVHGNPRSLDLSALGQVLTDTNLTPFVKGLMIWCTNPAVTQIDAGTVRRGLARENLFTVVLEHFMTDTARYADIILPSTTQLEQFDLVVPWGHHYIAANNPAVVPCGEAKSHGEVMRLLAPRLGLKGPVYCQSDESIAATALPRGVSMADLKAAGWIKASPRHPNPAASEDQLRFTGDTLEPVKSGRLRLLTPKSHHFLNSTFANMPRQRKAQGKPELEMNPADATERSLLHGQSVVLSNEQGEIHITLAVTEVIGVGAVSLSGKWWAEPLETNAVANFLTPPSWSPGGQPAYNDTFVEVTASKE